jgi:hypothetical protein
MRKAEGQPVDTKVPVTPENMLEHPETPSDMLHQHVRNIISDPDSKRSYSEAKQGITDAVNHPNISGQALADIYDYLTSPDVDDNYNALKHVLKNPKLPKEKAEQYLQNTVASRDHTDMANHTAAANHPGVDVKLLEQLASDQVNNPDLARTHSYENLSPEFYHRLLQERPIPEPEEGTMTEAQKATNEKVKKIDQLVTGGVGATTRHTPETLEQTIAAFSGQLPHGMETEKASSVLSDLVTHQKQLTPQQIDKIVATKFDTGKHWENDHRSQALSHPNASPILLSRYANSTNTDDSDLRDRALANPNLPEETKQAIISSPKGGQNDEQIRGLLENESLTPEDVRAIYPKNSDAVSHKNAPKDILEDFANKNNNAGGARKLLQRRDLPSSILTKIVTTNKNPAVVEEALKHHSVDMSVIQAALHRKAPWAQQAAMRHPLVAKQYMMDGLSSGKITPHDFLFDPKNRKAIGEIPPAAISHIDKLYAGDDKPDLADDHEVMDVKNWLATDHHVPEAIRDRNAKEISKLYIDSTTAGYTNANLGSHVRNLAQRNGNKDAQDAMLQRPALWGESDFTNPNYPTSFLDKVAEKLPEVAPGDQYKGYRRLLSRDIAHNPNVSLDTFRKISHDPEFLKDPSSVNASGHSWRFRDDDNHHTIFDKRWSDLSPEDRDNEFRQLNDLGTEEAKAAVLDSTSAPKDLWKQNFKTASPEELHDWFKNNDLKDYADDETLSDALHFRVMANDPRYPDRPETTPVDQALSALNPNKPEHRKMLTDFVQNIHALDEIRTIPRRTLVSHIPSEMLKGAEGSELIDKATRIDGTLGAELAGKRTIDFFNEDHKDLSDDDVRSAALRDLDSHAKLTSDDKPELYSMFWENMMSGAHPTSGKDYPPSVKALQQIAGNQYGGKPNGKLDFLADLPGDEPDYSIRKQALALDLISPDKVAELSDQDPKAFVESNPLLSDSIAHSRLDSFINRQMAKPMPSEESIEAAIKVADVGALTGWKRDTTTRRKQIASEQHLEAAQDMANKLIDLAFKHSQPSFQIMRLAKNIASSSTGGLNTAQTKQLVKSMVTKIQLSDQSEDLKNLSILSMFDAFSKEGEQDLLPGKMRTDIIKKSVESGHISTIVKILESGDAPRGAWSAVATALKNNPEKLDDSNLVALATVSKQDDASSSLKINLMNTMADRFASAPNTEGSYGLQMALRNMITRDIQSESSPEANAALDSGMKLIAASAHDPNLQELGMRAIVHAFNNNAIALEHRVAAFRSLPSDTDMSTTFSWENRPTKILSPDLVNLPGVIEAAQDGWKLAAMAFTAADFTSDTAKIIANRLVDSKAEGMDHPRKEFILRSISSTNPPEDSLDPIDAVKVVRTMDRNSQRDLMISLEDYVGPQPKDYMIMPTLLDTIEADFSNPEIGLSDLVKNTSALSSAAKSLSYAIEQDQSPQGVKVKHNYLLGRTVDMIGQVLDRMAPKSEQILDADSLSEINIRIYHAFNSVFMENTKNKHTEEIAFKYLNLLTKAKEFKSRIVDAPGIFNLKAIDLDSWTRSVDLPTEKWKTAFDMHPELAYALDMDVMTGEVLDALDYKSMLQNNYTRTKDLFFKWIGEIDKESRTKHVRAMLASLHEAITDPNTKSPDIGAIAYDTKREAFDSVAKQAVGYAGAAFDAAALKDLGSKVNPFNQGAIYDTAILNGAGGQDFAEYVWNSRVKRYDFGNRKEDVFASSPSITENIANGLIDNITTEGKGPHHYPSLIKKMLDNAMVPEKPFRRLLGATMEALPKLEKYERRGMIKGLMHHPRVDRDTYFKLYDETKDEYQEGFRPGQPFNPAFTNSKFGGALFRAQPVKIPDQFRKEVSPDNIVTRAEYSVAKNRLNEAMAVIPPEGITWADFKKQQPKMQNWPEVKQMFMSKNNKPVLPEDAVRAMSQHDGYDFHLTYSSWEGAQRHSKAPDFVMQLNTSEAMEKKLSADPKLWAFFQFVQKSANHVAADNIGGHPVTPHCASWVRIDTSGGKDGWIIEEFQSDFGARLHDEINSLVRKADQTDFHIDEFTFTADDMHKYTNDVADIVSGWHMASLNAVEELAKRNGVKNLFLHGAGIRAALSGMSKDRALPIWLQTMYDKVPKAEKWEAVDYSDYPNKGETGSRAKKAGYSTQCWKKPLKS